VKPKDIQRHIGMKLTWNFQQQRQFAERVIQLRAEHDLTQEDLAHKLEVSVRTIRNIERRHCPPSNKTTIRFGALEQKYREGKEIQKDLLRTDWVVN
jgi:DNA-binding XRE family transcriptional regulator